MKSRCVRWVLLVIRILFRAVLRERKFRTDRGVRDRDHRCYWFGGDAAPVHLSKEQPGEARNIEIPKKISKVRNDIPERILTDQLYKGRVPLVLITWGWCRSSLTSNIHVKNGLRSFSDKTFCWVGGNSSMGSLGFSPLVSIGDTLVLALLSGKSVPQKTAGVLANVRRHPHSPDMVLTLCIVLIERVEWES